MVRGLRYWDHLDGNATFRDHWPRRRDARRHIPDLMLKLGDGQILIVDVKLASRVDLPDAAAVFDWNSRVCAGLGWDYEVWSGEPVTTKANICFLGSTRRSGLIDSAMAALILDVLRDGQTVTHVLDAVSVAETDRSRARTALIHVMWCQVLVCELTRPLTTSTALRRGKGSGMSRTHEVIAGAHRWFEGSLWVVQELVGGGVVISQGTILRRVGFAMLAASNSANTIEDDDVQSVPQALGGLLPDQRKNL